MPGPRFSGPAGALLGALLVSVLAQACAEQRRETPVPVGAPKVILTVLETPLRTTVVAHISQRFCEGPSSMMRTMAQLQRTIDCSQDYKGNGGKGSIAEQIAASQVDIVLGGGTRHFDQPIEGDTETTVIDAAVANGYTVIRTREELASLSSDTKVLGLFSPGTMPVQIRGRNGAEARPIEKVEGQVRLPEPFACEPNPEFEDTPTLAEMTRKALGHLDDIAGYMLVVESASINKQSHVRRPCGHISELGQLDEALGVALGYSEAHPETLILVTADHTHAAQIVAETGLFVALNYASPGRVARLRTPEGGIMGVNYATNDSGLSEFPN